MVLLAGISTLLMGLATNIWFGTLFFMMPTASSVILNITFSSLLILEIEDQYRGRLFSLISLFSVFLMPPLAIIGGIIADLFAVQHLFYFTGIYMTVIALYPLIDKDIKNLAKLPS
ncbi:hypothetical protein AB990_21065 [Alkalihalobacillus pseudalcaliphilus]|nr:hypothetical protein AB990_21065 [Alkalihalobacillus pseudalcaliphilus]